MTTPQLTKKVIAGAALSLVVLTGCSEQNIYGAQEAHNGAEESQSTSTSQSDDSDSTSPWRQKKLRDNDSDKDSEAERTERSHSRTRTPETRSGRNSRRDSESRSGRNSERSTETRIPRPSSSRVPQQRLTSTQVRPAPPDSQSDSPIYHSSEEWAWLNDPAKVVPGGRIINVTRNGSCSTGWIVGVQKRRFILTAGHCGKVRDQFAVTDKYGNKAIIGEMVESLFLQAGGDDYGLIELYNMKYVDAKIPFTQKLAAWRTSEWLDKYRPRVCHLGYRTGQSCGSYLGLTQNGIIQFRGYVDHGDSGGPVYTVLDNKVYAVGIISYRQPTDATRVSAQAIGPAMKRWGLTIYAS